MPAKFAVYVAALCLLLVSVRSSDAAPSTSSCDAYDGAARTHCHNYCDVRHCNVEPDPVCEQLRKNFVKKTGTTVFPCDVTATATSTATPLATATAVATETPTVTATPLPSATATATPGATTCPEVLQLSPGAGTLDVGWKGFAHGLPTGTGDVFTVDVTDCANATPPCGVCNLSGPIANVVADGTPETQRCAGAIWVRCVSDADCATDGPCVIFAGAPAPFSAGGAAACVLTEVVDVKGTIDVESGATIVNLSLQSQVEPTTAADHPCPRCIGDVIANDGTAAGTCDDGVRAGVSCDASALPGFTSFGPTSFDCPPTATANTSVLPLSLQLTSDTATRTLSVESPDCRAFGSTSKCFCDTCNEGRFLACASNADCPDPAGPIGPICGGTRCLGGTNDGAACTTPSECPGGSAICGAPGEVTQPNRCEDGTCTETTDDHGTCAAGPMIGHCQPSKPFEPCSTVADCSAVGDTCVIDDLSCFPDNGALGASISITGAPNPLGADLTAHPTLAGLTCVAGSASSAINVVAGLPGMLRITVPVTILDPTATP